MNKRKLLEQHGFIVGRRDRNLNRAFSGKFMVSESYEAGTMTDSAAQGPRCIVGDNLAELIAQAFDNWIEEEIQT